METAKQSFKQQVRAKLDYIQSELTYLKKHIDDPDVFLTPEEEILLRASYENEKKGELVSHAELKRILGR